MEITELNLIGDFEAGMKCFQSPSLLSKLSLMEKVPRLYGFWTFGALVLAVLATITSVFNRIKLFLHVIRDKVLSCYRKSCPQQIFDQNDFDFDSSDDDDGDDTPSSVAESDEEEIDSENDQDNDVLRVRGNTEGNNGNFSQQRRNGFSWSDFSTGKSVVQLWDSFGLGLDFEDDEFDSESEISIWDLDRDVKLSSGRRCVMAVTPESVVLTAEMNVCNDGVGFSTYDSRVDGKSPAIYTTWRPRRRNISYYSDDAGQKEE